MATITAAAGGGNWNSTATWTGGVVPTSADDAVLASTSGSVTITAAAACRSLDANGYTGTLTHNTGATLSVGTSTPGTGNIALRFAVGMTYTIADGTSAITFVSTSATQQTVNFGGKTTGIITFNGVGGSWILASAITTVQSNTYGLIVTAGSFASGDFNITTGVFTSTGSAVRSISLGASAINLASNGGGGWNISGSNYSLNAGTSSITVNNSNNSTNFGAGLTYYNFSLQYGNGSGDLIGAGTSFNNLTLLGGNQARFMLANSYTVTGLLTINSAANNQNNMPIVMSNQVNTRYTITVSSAPTITYAIFQDFGIVGPGTPYATTYTGDAGNNSGMTLSAPRTLYLVTTGSQTYQTSPIWATTSGGSGLSTPPVPQDTVIIDANSFSATGRTLSMGWQGFPTLDFTNATNNPIINITNTNGLNFFFGDLRLKAGMTSTGSNSSLVFMGKTDQILDTKGIQLNNRLSNLEKAGTVLKLQSDLNFMGNFVLERSRSGDTDLGTFDANGYNVTTSALVSTNPATTTRTLKMGSGTWTINGTGTVLDLRQATAMILQPQTSTLLLSDTSATAKNISFDSSATGWDLWNMTIAAGGSAATWTWSGIVRVNNNLILGGPNTISLANANVTKTVSGITTIGASGQPVNIISNAVGQPTYLNMNGNSSAQSIDSSTTRTDTVFQFNVQESVLAQTLPNASPNLLPNPSFDNGTTGYTLLEGAAYTVQGFNSYLGNNHLHVVNAAAGGGSGYSSGVQTNIAAGVLTAGQTYTFSCYVRSDNPNVIFNIYPAASTTPNTQVSGTLTTSWQRYSITFVAASSNATSVNPRANPVNADWDIDGIRLEAGSGLGPAIEAGNNLVPNPSFESGVSGWQIGNIPSGTTLTSSSAFAYTGQLSARVLNTGTSADDVYIYYTITGLPTNSVYTFSGWRYLETRTSNPSGFRALLAYAAGITGVVTATETSTATGVWVRHQLTANTLNGTTLLLRLYNPPGISYWDGIQVEPGYNATPYSDSGLVGQTNIQRALGKGFNGSAAAVVNRGLFFPGGAAIAINVGNNSTPGVPGYFDAVTAVTVALRYTPYPYQSPNYASGTLVNHRSSQGAQNFRQYTLEFLNGNSNRLQFNVNKADNSARVGPSTPTGLNNGQEYLVVCRYDGSNVSIWLDGVKQAELPMTGNIGWDSTSSQPLYIGQFDSGASAPTRGVYRDVAIWKDYALTDTQIANLPAALDSKTLANMPGSSNVAIWLPLDDGTNTSPRDLGINNISVVGNSKTVVVNSGLLKSITKPISYGATAISGIFKGVTKLISRSSSAAVSMTNQKAFKRTLAAAGTSVAALIRTIAKTLSAASTGSATIGKQIAKILSAAGTSATSITSQSKRFITLAYNATALPRLVAQGLHYVKMTISAVANVGLIRRIIIAFRRTQLSQDKENITVLKQGE